MKLFRNYLGMHLKSSLEYKSAFILTLISQGLVMVIELFTIYALFSKFKLLSIYDVYSLILGFSTMWLAFSSVEMLARGFDNFYKLIVNGNFDLLLIRPRTLFIQILGSEICYEKFSRVFIAFILFIYSSTKVIRHFSLNKLLLLIQMYLGCTVVILSLFIIGASLCFYTVQGLEAANVFTYGTKQVGEYPMGIFNKTIKFIFTFIIPISLTNYYPIEYLKENTTNVLYLLMPYGSIPIFVVSLFIFRLGIKKYTSTGS